jgi:NADH-quinone oxidoreductase subunit K
MIVPLEHVIFLAASIFLLGLLCVLMHRSLVMILIGVEIMINGAGLVLVGASAFWQQVDGQLMVLVLMALTSAEVAISLAMVVYLQRRKNSIDIRSFDRLRG